MFISYFNLLSPKRGGGGEGGGKVTPSLQSSNTLKHAHFDHTAAMNIIINVHIR